MSEFTIGRRVVRKGSARGHGRVTAVDRGQVEVDWGEDGRRWSHASHLALAPVVHEDLLCAEKTARGLHGVRDRVEMIQSAFAAAERWERYAERCALNALRAEEKGDMQEVTLWRQTAFQTMEAHDRALDAYTRLFPNRDLGRAAPYEEEASAMLQEVCEYQRPVLFGAMEEQAARRLLEDMRIAFAVHFGNPSNAGSELSHETFLRVLRMSEEERKQWLEKRNDPYART